MGTGQSLEAFYAHRVREGWFVLVDLLTWGLWALVAAIVVGLLVATYITRNRPIKGDSRHD